MLTSKECINCILSFKIRVCILLMNLKLASDNSDSKMKQNRIKTFFESFIKDHLFDDVERVECLH